MKSYTDLEQSKKLAEFLPPESANMFWRHCNLDNLDYPIMQTSFEYIRSANIPCWSLAALLGVIKEQGLVDLRFLQSTFDNRGNHLINVWCCTFENLGTVTLDLYADNPIDACVAMIEKLHKSNLL